MSPTKQVVPALSLCACKLTLGDKVVKSPAEISAILTEAHFLPLKDRQTLAKVAMCSFLPMCHAKHIAHTKSIRTTQRAACQMQLFSCSNKLPKVFFNMRYAVKFVAILCIFFVPFIGCKQQAPETSQELAELAVKPLFIKNLSEFERSLAVLDSLIAQAKEDSSHAKALQEAFKHARLAYKRMEFLLEYYAPSTSEAMNGPALEEVGEEYKIEQPTGFQVLEEFLFPEVDFSSREAMLAQVKIMRSLCKRLDGLIIQKATDR
jgi:hypothetical protein